MSGELERLAYEVSLKALERQENVIDELRSRAGTLLAASSLSASFLGARALDHAGATWLGLIALGLFGVSVGSAVYVLLPRTELILALKGSRIFTPDLGGQGLAETYRRLTYWIEAFLERNESSIDRLFIFFRIAAGSSLAGAIPGAFNLSAEPSKPRTFPPPPGPPPPDLGIPERRPRSRPGFVRRLLGRVGSIFRP